ncbi:hypothetical protein FIBSPDRAFT_876353, partial [Athelia psychrophila]
MPLLRGLKTSSARSSQPLFTCTPYVAPQQEAEEEHPACQPLSWTRQTITSAGTRTRMSRGSYQHSSGARSRGRPG